MDWPAKVSSSYLRPGQCTFVKRNDKENKDYCCCCQLSIEIAHLNLTSPQSSLGILLILMRDALTPRPPFGHASPVPSSVCDQWG